MSIANAIEMEIRAMIEKRYTQTEIAEMLKIKPNQLSVLLSGIRSFGGMRVGTVDRAFPNLTIQLNGKQATLNVGDNSTVAVASSINSYNGFDKSTLQKKVLDLDIDDTAKVKVLRLLEGM